MSFSLELQKAIFEKLNADSNVTSLVSGVYDCVTEFAEFPYISIGEDSLNEWGTDTTNGVDATITVHAWSRGRPNTGEKGRKQSKEILGAVYDSLHRQNLIVSGYDFVSVDYDTETSFLDSDGLTYHGVQTYRVLIDKN